MKKAFRITSISYSTDDDQIVEQAQKIALRERVSFSKVVVTALKEYTERHQHGNPQTPLFPSRIVDSYHNPPAEARKGHIDDLLDTIKANPGANMQVLINKFAAATGYRAETIRDYFKVLERSKAIVITNNGVYPRGK